MSMSYPSARHLAIGVILLSVVSNAQVALTTLGTSVTIDFTATVPGVNNGLFGAQAPLGSNAPTVGQLDLNAWNYFSDGSATSAAQNAANFPGAMPNGNGLGTAGNLTGGISAVDVIGHRALAIQPIATHWTSGSMTLRAINSTAGSMEQLAVSYDLCVYNDQDRANDVRFFYSLSAAQDSWVEVANAAVTSPEAMDVAPAWGVNTVSFTISGFSLNPGDVIYLRWVGNDVSGSGSRDEFAFTNIVLTPQAATGPNIITSVTGLPPFSQIAGAPSAANSFIVVGTNLTDDITITAPAPFQVSLDELSGYSSSIVVPQAGGSVLPTTVYAHLNSADPGTFSGSIELMSPGAGPALVGVSGTTTAATIATVYINEVMPHNVASGIHDENGESDDWFELFAQGTGSVDLSGWYVTNDALDLTKYQFPLGGSQAIVQANDYLVLWADDQSFQGDLHVNFTLDDAGGTILLVAPDGTSIADQITYGAVPADATFGHLSDGTGPLGQLAAPTPGASNTSIGIAENQEAAPLRGWPVPATTTLELDRPVSGVVMDVSGRTILVLRGERRIDTSKLRPGTYVLRTVDGARLRFTR